MEPTAVSPGGGPSFQVHPPPSSGLDRLLSSVLGPGGRRVHPGPAVYRSPRHNTVITEQTAPDLHQIKEAVENNFSLENWQAALDRRDSNRRHLSDTVNSIHILEGSDCRYFFGIIDIFTTYGWRQRLVRLVKNIRLTA